MIKPQRVALYLLLILMSAFFIAPFWIAGIVSIRDTNDLYSYPIHEPTSGEEIELWENFISYLHGGWVAHGSDKSKSVFTYNYYIGLEYLRNSLMYGIFGSMGAILIASLGAYSITKIPYRGSYVLFLLIFSMIFFPSQIYLIPLWDILRITMLYNTLPGMMLIYVGLGAPFATFILRNHFVTISKEILESARMDGASELRIWATIVMPLAKPALAVCFIFVFNFIMQDFLFASVMVSTSSIRPTMPFIYSLVHVGSVGKIVNWPVGTVGALFASLPTIIVFIALQKYFVRGILMGAVKR